MLQSNINPETGKPVGYDSSNYEREVLIELFKAKGITKYKFSDADSFARYDVIFEHKGHKFIAELKNRNITSTKYNTTLLEASKVDWLRATAKRNDLIPVYIATFTDHKFIMFDLNKVARTVPTKEMPSLECSCIEGTRLVKKKVYLIPMESKDIKDLGFERKTIGKLKLSQHAEDK